MFFLFCVSLAANRLDFISFFFLFSPLLFSFICYRLFLVKNSNLFQIKYVPYIESIIRAKMSFVSFFLFLSAHPIPPPYIWLSPYWSIIICSLPLYYLPFTYLFLFSLSLSLSKNDQYSLLDWTCWIFFFFKCFPFYFRFILRAPSCLLHMTEKNKRKQNKWKDLLLYSAHTQRRKMCRYERILNI